MLTTPQATRNDLIGALAKSTSPAEIERSLVSAKLDLVAPLITPGTVVYTEFLDGILPVIRERVESFGFTVGEYTGRDGRDARDQDKQAFIDGKLDVLIGSATIKVGVDGLQHRANRLILLGTPWTSRGWDQVLGRVHRQGSQFESVEVVHPQVAIRTDFGEWSWDAIRLNAVHAKRRLAEAAMDGALMNEERLSQDELTRLAMSELRQLLVFPVGKAA